MEQLLGELWKNHPGKQILLHFFGKISNLVLGLSSSRFPSVLWVSGVERVGNCCPTWSCPSSLCFAVVAFFVIVLVLWGFLFVHFSGVVDVKSGCCQCFILKRLCFPQQLLCLYQSILLLSKWPCLEKNGGGSGPVTAQIMKFVFASCAAANEEVQAGRWVCAGAPWPCSDALEVRSAKICQCQPNGNYWLFFRSLNETSFSQRVLPWIVLSCEPVLWGLGTSVKKLSEIKIESLSSWEV